MTKKFKSLSLFLILGLLISNFSCQVDESIVEKENNDKKKDFIIKNLNNNEIIKNKKIATKLDNLKASIADIKSKTVYNSEFDFYIDAEQALYVESNDSLYHSYTFQINRTIPSNNLENLFLSLQEDGSYKSYIVTYNVTEQEKNQIYNNVQVNLENKVSYLEIDNTSMQNDIFARETPFCIYVISTTCSQGNHVDGYLNGIECPAHQLVVSQFCTSTTGSGDTSSGDYSGGDGSLGGSPGTGSGGGVNSNNNITAPLYVKQPWEKVLECLGLDLSNESLVWLKQNKRAADQISSYLDENECDADAKEFAEELIDELANISIDSYPGKEDLFPFEWWNDDALIEQYLQGPYESWRNISSEEKRLTKSFPTIAYKLYKNKDIAFQKTFQYFGNVPQVLNGKPDAFRHAFFQAINTVSVRKYFTELFANAHESEVPTIWSLEKEMDIYNNEIGMNLIEFTHPNWSNTNQIATEILNMLNNGELIYLKPINYSSPYFWDNLSTSTPNDGNHGISNNTQLTPTNQ